MDGRFFFFLTLLAAIDKHVSPALLVHTSYAVNHRSLFGAGIFNCFPLGLAAQRKPFDLLKSQSVEGARLVGLVAMAAEHPKLGIRLNKMLGEVGVRLVWGGGSCCLLCRCFVDALFRDLNGCSMECCQKMSFCFKASR